MYNTHFFLTNFASKSRCTLYTEPFVFMLGNLHNNQKVPSQTASNFMQQVEINQDKKFI